MKVYQIIRFPSFPVVRGKKPVHMWLSILVKINIIFNDNYRVVRICIIVLTEVEGVQEVVSNSSN